MYLEICPCLIKVIISFTGHTEKIYFIRFHPLAKDVVLTASYDMTIKLWDLSDNTEQIELTSHTDEVGCYSQDA